MKIPYATVSKADLNNPFLSAYASSFSLAQDAGENINSVLCAQ